MAVYNNILLMNHCITALHYLPDSLAVLFNTTIIVATWADKNIFIITEMLCVKLYSKDRQAKVSFCNSIYHSTFFTGLCKSKYPNVVTESRHCYRR